MGLMDKPVAEKVKTFFTAYPEHHYSKGELLLRPGDDVPHIFYLLEGQIAQYDITPAGNSVVVNVFKPGAFFPMSCVVNDQPSQYFFEASGKVRVHQAPAAEALAFVHKNPDVLFDLLARVYRGADGLLRRLTHLMGSDAKTRLVFEIVNAAARFGEPQPGGGTRLVLTEVELGQRTGLARETVSRALRQLKAAGLVRVGRKELVIPDLAALQQLLDDTI